MLPLALHLAIAVPLAFLLNVWQDDAYTLHSTARGVAYAWHEAVTFEQNAPLYFVVLTIWRHVNESAAFARMFSVICAAGTVLLTPPLAARYVPSLSTRWITYSVALNPFFIWAALEIRVYALVVLLSAVLLLLFHKAFLEKQSRTGDVLFYAAVCIAAAYTQYYLLFLISAQGVLLAIFRRDRFLRFAGSQLLVAAAFTPMLAIVPAQMSNFRSVFTPPSLPQVVRVLGEILIFYALPVNRISASHIIEGAFAAVTAGMLALFLVKYPSLKRGDWRPFTLFASSFAIFALALYLTHEHALTRHAAWMFVPLMLFIFSLFSFVAPWERERAAAACCAAFIVVDLAALGSTYRALAKPGDWARVTSFIEQRERPGQAIVIYQAENAVPFEYYYRGSNRVAAVPQAPNFRTYDPADFAVRSRTQLDRSFAGTRTVWLVQAGDCRALSLDFGCAVVDRYVRAHYRTVLRRDFYRSTVRLLVRRSASKQSNMP